MRRRKKFNPDEMPVAGSLNQQNPSKVRHAAAVALTAAIISSSVVSGPAAAQKAGINPIPAPLVAATAPEVTMGGMIQAGTVPYDETKMVADQSPALKKFITSITSGALLPNVTLADQMVAGVGGNELGYSYGKEIADKLDKENTPDGSSQDEELASTPDEKRGSGEGPGNLADRDSDTSENDVGTPDNSTESPGFETPSLGGQPNELAQVPDNGTSGDTPSQPEQSSSYDPSGEIAQMGIPGTSEPAPVPESPSDTPSEPAETPETELAQGPGQTPSETPSETPSDPDSSSPQETPTGPPSGVPEDVTSQDPESESGQGPPEWAGGPGGNPEPGSPETEDGQIYSPDESTEDLSDSGTPAPEQAPEEDQDEQGPPEWAGGPGGNPDNEDDSGEDSGDEEKIEIDQQQTESPAPDNADDQKPEGEKPNSKPETETDSEKPQQEDPQAEKPRDKPHQEQPEDPQSGKPEVSKPGNGKSENGGGPSTPPAEDEGPGTGQNPQNDAPGTSPNNTPDGPQPTPESGNKPNNPIGASDDTDKAADEYVQTGDGDDAFESARNDVSNKTDTAGEFSGVDAQ